jgi:hypothetical protein
MSVSVAYIIQGDNIILTVDNDNFVVNKNTHVNYDEIVEAINNEDWEQLALLVDVKRSIASFYDGDIEIKNGYVLVKGKRLNQALSDRLIEMYRAKLPLNSLLLFLRNLVENPSRVAVQELYEFLEANTLPITTDGCFLAYKRVQLNEEGNLVDCWTKEINNNVGQTVSMARNDVDDDRRNTCSAGLHFCSLNYLSDSGYGSGAKSQIVLVKVNPKDVVSIPPDYNNSKGRCCEYTVIGVHDKGTDEEAYTSPVYSVENA